MKTLTQIPVKYDLKKLVHKLRVEPGSRDADDLAALIDLVASATNPKALFSICYIRARTPDTVNISGVVFSSRTLQVNTEKVERVFPFIATCGTEFDKISIPDDDILKQYWLDELKAVALRCTLEYLFAHWKKHYGLHKITSMSPGSGDLEIWPIEQQQHLFSLLGDTESLVGVRLTDSCLMIPNKTISGIAYPSEVSFETCRLCHRLNCPGRMAPLDEALCKSIHGD